MLRLGSREVDLPENRAAGSESGPSSIWLYATCVLLAAGLMLYAQTRAFTFDEGFHLLAAQLIKGGMRPYLDFCFPQTPLNAYWNAFWMQIFGDSWRTAHALSALETSVAVALAAQFVYSRWPERSWRVAGALAAAAIIGFNANLVEFGVLGQAYGMCLFASVSAFRLTVAAVDRRASWTALSAGVFAGIVAASSLLAAMVGPVLLIWMLRHTRDGRRAPKCVAFILGGALPFLPVLRLFTRAPWVVWFNLAEYHLKFRQVYWPDSVGHDVETLTAWISDPQSLLMGLLAIFGVLYVARRSDWTPERRAEFYLCGWLTVGLAAELAFTHPTFPRYFCLLVPFAGILSVAGLYALGSRVLAPDRPFWPVVIMTLISAGNLGETLYAHRGYSTWPEYETLAKKLAAVTPPHGRIFADEGIYFVAKTRPPRGMEFGYSHKLPLTLDRLAELHVMSEGEMQLDVAAGDYASAATCDADDVATYGLEQSFEHSEDLHNCTIYWGWKRREAKPAASADFQPRPAASAK
jgi:hypothetical protein